MRTVGFIAIAAGIVLFIWVKRTPTLTGDPFTSSSGSSSAPTPSATPAPSPGPAPVPNSTAVLNNTGIGLNYA